MGLLRFFLALSVLVRHSSPIFGLNFVGGQTAVQAFYIISGFYMALILTEKYVGKNGSYKLFITNRFLRLYPIYWVVFLLTIFSSLAFAVYTNGSDWGFLNTYVIYFNSINIGSVIFLVFSNLFIFFQDLALFLGLDVVTGKLFFGAKLANSIPPGASFFLVPQAWTIGIELIFYLLAPFFVKKKTGVIMIFIFLALLLKVALFNFGLRSDAWTYKFFPTEIGFFILGILSYRIYCRMKNEIINHIYLKTIFVSIILFTIFYNYFPILNKNWVYLLLLFISLPFIFILTKKWKNDYYIGQLSYPIYISHQFILGIIINLFFVNSDQKWLGAVLTVSTIFFSIILNELVAKKIEKIRQKRIVSLPD